MPEKKTSSSKKPAKSASAGSSSLKRVIRKSSVSKTAKSRGASVKKSISSKGRSSTAVIFKAKMTSSKNSPLTKKVSMKNVVKQMKAKVSVQKKTTIKVSKGQPKENSAKRTHQHKIHSDGSDETLKVSRPRSADSKNKKTVPEKNSTSLIGPNDRPVSAGHPSATIGGHPKSAGSNLQQQQKSKTGPKSLSQGAPPAAPPQKVEMVKGMQTSEEDGWQYIYVWNYIDGSHQIAQPEEVPKHFGEQAEPQVLPKHMWADPSSLGLKKTGAGVNNPNVAASAIKVKQTGGGGKAPTLVKSSATVKSSSSKSKTDSGSSSESRKVKSSSGKAM